MTLQQIRYIMEISKWGSINTAAEKLYLTQPYLSRVLRDLEHELKISIFNREHKGVSLTDAGKEFLYYARPMIEQEDSITSLYKTQIQKAPMRFTISTQRFPFIVKSFHEFYKEICPDSFEIHIHETSMDRVIYNVYEKRCELGVISISSMTERFLLKYLSQRNLQFHEIINTTPCVFFHKDHPMAIHNEINISDMSAYPFVSFESGAAVSLDFSEEVIIAEAPRFAKHFYVTDRATVINLLTNTDAFSMGSGILSPKFAGPELVSKPIIGHQNELKLGWICADSNRLSNEGRMFVEKIKEVMAQE